MTTGIAGSTGFIGSYLARYLGARNTTPLRLLARNAAADYSPDGAEVLQGDLMSRADCERFADGVQVIFYLAHKNTPVDSDFDLPSDALVNLIPLLNLLAAIERLGTKPHIVYFSSGGAVYERKSERVPYSETDICAPRSSYGIQKLVAEQYLRLAADKGYLTASVLRVGNAYGTLLPQFRMQGLIGVALNQVVHGRPVRIFGNPNNVRDYLHLDDICDVAVRSSAPRKPFELFNVGSGVGHSVLEVIRIIEECWGRPIEIHSDDSRGGWLPDWVVLDIAKVRAETGWCPELDLRKGIGRMLVEMKR